MFLYQAKRFRSYAGFTLLADRLHSGRKVTMPEPWERLSTEEKIDFLRREVEGLKQVLTALARRVDEDGVALKTLISKRGHNDE